MHDQKHIVDLLKFIPKSIHDAIITGGITDVKEGSMMDDMQGQGGKKS
jgi:hypothetical protein